MAACNAPSHVKRIGILVGTHKSIHQDSSMRLQDVALANDECSYYKDGLC